MAEKRCISKSISISEKVNLQLTSNFSRLLYTWLIPHLDDFGRINGSAAKIKALVVPMLSETKDDVTEAIQSMHDEKLIIWYEVDGSKYIQFLNFEDHQQGLHKRTKSKIPEYIPGSSGKFQEIPLEEKGTELNRTEEEGNRREEKKPSHNFLPLINKLNLKCKGIWESDQVESYLTTMEPELIEEALKRSEHKGSVAYALGILIDWLGQGFKTLDDIKPKSDNLKRFPNSRNGQSGKPNIPIVPTDSGPTTIPTPEELEAMREHARKMDARFGNKGAG